MVETSFHPLKSCKFLLEKDLIIKPISMLKTSLRISARYPRTRLSNFSYGLANVSISRFASTVGKTLLHEDLNIKQSTGILGKDTTLEHNIKSETNRLEKTLKKFWEKVNVAKHADGFTVQLDTKPIRTPLGNNLIIPKSKEVLAHLIAHEWKILPNLKIKPHSVPLTSIASRAIDLSLAEKKKLAGEELNADDAMKLASKNDIVDGLLNYLDTDTLLVFSPLADHEGKLRKAQEDTYEPIIKYFEEYFSNLSGKQIKLKSLDSELGLMGNQQTPETREIVKNWLHQLDIWDLCALEKTTLVAKSFIAGFLIINKHLPPQPNAYSNITVDEICNAVNLETIFQTQEWGEVEDTHDVDHADLRRNLGASLIASHSV